MTSTSSVPNQWAPIRAHSRARRHRPGAEAGEEKEVAAVAKSTTAAVAEKDQVAKQNNFFSQLQGSSRQVLLQRVICTREVSDVDAPDASSDYQSFF
jgi:hypothetical protein